MKANEAFVCTDCDERWYYTRPWCPTCAESATVDSYDLGVGVVVARTTAHVTPEDVRAPNHLALVDFDGVSLVAQSEEKLDPDSRVRFDGEHRLRGEAETAVYGPRLVVVDE